MGKNLARKFQTESLPQRKSVPLCHYCKYDNGQEVPAEYDASDNTGRWRYMCDRHFKINGIGLGDGKGTKLKILYGKE